MRNREQNEKRFYEYLFFPMIFTIIAAILLISWLNYTEIRDTIIAQEQQYLYTIADTAAKSLEQFVRDRSEELRIISNVKSFQEEFMLLLDGKVAHISFPEFLYKTQQNDIEVVQILDRNGVIVDQYPFDVENRYHIGRNISHYSDVNFVLVSKQASSGNVYFPEAGKGVMSFVEPVFHERKFLGIIRYTIALDSIYKRFIQPIKVGKWGYASVKDQNGVLLMHPKGEDIGKYVIDARRAEFPSFDWSELEKQVERQKLGQSGVGIYHSIWYTDKARNRVKKFNAFVPARIGIGFWIVNVSMDYSEILDIIRRPLYNTFGFALFIIVIFGIGLYNIGKMKEEKEKMEVQTFLIYQSRLATMGEMIGNIAHQWRQPLGSLSLILSNLKDAYDYHELDEKYMNESVSKAGKILRKMSETIDDFRFFFNPKRDKEEFSVYQNILYCLELSEERLKLNQIEVDLEQVSDAKVYGHSNQYSQVIINIINNSVDALLQANLDGKKLTIKITESTGQVITEITDNGGGIDETLLDKIYDPYFTTKPNKTGTGLGLYMSKMIIERNFHGTLQLKNVENGVCAKISIPKSGDEQNE